MKVSVILAALLGVTVAGVISNTDTQLTTELLKTLLEKYQDNLSDRKGGSITATVNEFTDKLLANLGPFAIERGLEPISLSDITQKFLAASITLDHGTISGISQNVSRNGNVDVTYEHDKKLLTLKIPLVFKKISFAYDYHVVVIFVKPSGKMTGSITDFKLTLELGFDLNTYQAKLNYIKTSDSGHISVHFDGNLSDVILNILTEFVTTILHPILQGVVEAIIKKVATNVVDSVNKGINDTLHPNATNYFLPEKYPQFVKLY